MGALAEFGSLVFPLPQAAQRCAMKSTFEKLGTVLGWLLGVAAFLIICQVAALIGGLGLIGVLAIPGVGPSLLFLETVWGFLTNVLGFILAATVLVGWLAVTAATLVLAVGNILRRAYREALKSGGYALMLASPAILLAVFIIRDR